MVLLLLLVLLLVLVLPPLPPPIYDAYFGTRLEHGCFCCCFCCFCCFCCCAAAAAGGGGGGGGGVVVLVLLLLGRKIKARVCVYVSLVPLCRVWPLTNDNAHRRRSRFSSL
jgi:hypothetical protein